MGYDPIARPIRVFGSTNLYRRRRQFCSTNPHLNIVYRPVQKGYTPLERMVFLVQSGPIPTVSAYAPTIMSTATVNIALASVQLSDP